MPDISPSKIQKIRLREHFDTSDLACKIGGFVNQQNQGNETISENEGYKPSDPKVGRPNKTR